MRIWTITYVEAETERTEVFTSEADRDEAARKWCEAQARDWTAVDASPERDWRDIYDDLICQAFFWDHLILDQHDVGDPGVWVLFYWLYDEDPVTAVFQDERAANTAALSVAQSLWDRCADEDWPIQPETWSEIYEEVLERHGEAGDFMQLEYQTVRGTFQ